MADVWAKLIDSLDVFAGTPTAITGTGGAGSSALFAAGDHTHAIGILTQHVNFGGFLPQNLGTPSVGSDAATKTYVDNAVVGLWDFKGSTDASANPNYPAASKGDSYAVSVAGKVGGASGKSVDVGDVYVASADNAGGTEASVGTSWFVLEHNLAGALLASNNLSDVANAGTARTNLGLGTAATQNTGAFDAAGAAAAAQAASQPLDTDLTAIAALTSAADKAPYATGAGTWALADLTAAGRAMNGAASAAAQTALLSNMVGDSGAGGTKGLVPAPASGDAAASKYLKADGTWAASVPGGSAGGSLTGTYPNPTIAADAVTDAMLRDSAAVSVLGRSAGSVGNPADIVAGTSNYPLSLRNGTLQFAIPAAPVIANAAARPASGVLVPVGSFVYQTDTLSLYHLRSV